MGQNAQEYGEEQNKGADIYGRLESAGNGAGKSAGKTSRLKLGPLAFSGLGFLMGFVKRNDACMVLPSLLHGPDVE